MNETIVFDGYFAELIALRAEREGKTPQEYILSFFVKGCNAPDVASLLPEGCNAP